MARNWIKYNEALVKHGEILLSLDFLKNWNKWKIRKGYLKINLAI